MIPKLAFTFKVLGAAAGITLFAHPAISVEFTPYVHATPQGQPKGAVGINFIADALDLRGAITTKRAGTMTLVTPQLVSSFAVAREWNIETRATFANWNEGHGPMGDAVETKLTAHSALPMFDEIEGLVGRNAAGASHRKLRFKMNEATVPSFLSEPIQLKTNATIEQVGIGNATSSLLTGVEAALVQKLSSDSAYNRVGFKYTTQTGATEYQRQAATFSRSWAHNNLLRLGVECEVIQEAASLRSAFKFTWQGFF